MPDGRDFAVDRDRGPSRSSAGEIDLSQAVVVVPDGLRAWSPRPCGSWLRRCARTHIDWDVKIRWPSAEVPVIAVGPGRMLDSLPTAYRQHVPSRPTGKEKEGFLIGTVKGAMPRRWWRSSATTDAGCSSAPGGCCASCASRRATCRCRRASTWLGAQVSAPRPSARLSAQDQLLRRLGPGPVGAVYPRAGDLRHQRHRADPAPLRRRCRQPAFSACRRSK